MANLIQTTFCVCTFLAVTLQKAVFVLHGKTKAKESKSEKN